MLTNEVKQRINTCRGILVGKLPDPKSQVIQITNALIYKFMDDQDRLSEKMGGKVSFFTGALKPYAWHKLFDSKLTNQERADLYVTGIERLSAAQNLPELFREIFKEAYVPFKAASTITLFIEEINKFSYHHSEELGNAYEYLLSIMGSQGDAGQFRTPRHIIEFMVDIIDPQKTETVYDPACGTAGFLIAAYTHILEANNGKLSATDKKKLSEHISGIDISPDMAKMARVNLYLHGFTSPVINEGDTLSDEDLWDTKYDVILANPPFMSPTGGIIPHDKFGIKAKRSEVLFVDYIAEHLKLKGRAAIVVPEGVIFQSGSSYKDLRKMLVEDGYLHSVISLPAGVFQPYSGVKTSILVLDRERAKEATEVLFLKIENDGFTLNTQRTERLGGQLEEALAIACAWQQGKKQETTFASWVTKKEIAESGDYTLTGERYRIFETVNNTYPLLSLGELVDLNFGERITKKEHSGDKYPVYGGGGESFRTDKYNREDEYVISRFAMSAECVRYVKGQFWMLDSGGTFSIAEKYKSQLTKEYVGRILLSIQDRIYDCARGGAQKNLDTNQIKSLKIPLPPIEVQREIVAELDRYQKIIDGARQVVENYKSSFKIDPEWECLPLSEVCDVRDGTHDSPKYVNDGYPLITSKNLKGNFIDFKNVKYISKVDYENFSKRSGVSIGDVLFAMIGTIGNPLVIEDSREFAIKNVALFKLENSPKLNNYYLRYLLDSDYTENNLISKARGGTQRFVSLTDIRNFIIPVPSIEVQKILVQELANERSAIEEVAKLILRFEKKIKDKIAEVWGV